jgi:hypothetical protein
MYDQGKGGRVAGVEASLKAGLEAARKAFKQELEAQLDANAAKKMIISVPSRGVVLSLLLTTGQPVHRSDPARTRRLPMEPAP